MLVMNRMGASNPAESSRECKLGYSRELRRSDWSAALFQLGEPRAKYALTLEAALMVIQPFVLGCVRGPAAPRVCFGATMRTLCSLSCGSW